MVKVFISILISTVLYANIFETNCLKCHTNPKDLKLFMAEYTLKYSSENKIKAAMFQFLRNPTSNKSIMPYSYIKDVGFKPDSILDDKQLHKAIDIYYKKFNLKHFIK